MGTGGEQAGRQDETPRPEDAMRYGRLDDRDDRDDAEAHAMRFGRLADDGDLLSISGTDDAPGSEGGWRVK